MIGRFLLRFRQKFGHGLRTAWYRDVVRPRLLHTPPVTGTTDDHCEIHVLTSAQDWLNLVWAVKSFYWNGKRNYSLCIHGDATLAPSEIEMLSRHFPDARIITKSEADAA